MDIKRIVTAAIEAALEEGQPEPRDRNHRNHRGLKALAVGVAPFATGAAVVTAARAGRKHLPLPARFALSKLVDLPDVGGIAQSAREGLSGGADALRERVTHQDADTSEDVDAQHEDDGDDGDLTDEILADAYEQGDDGDADEPSDDDADEQGDDEHARDEVPFDEGSDESENDEAAEPQNIDAAEPEPRDLVLEMNRGSKEQTPDLFGALRDPNPRPSVMQALNRRTRQAANRS